MRNNPSALNYQRILHFLGAFFLLYISQIEVKGQIGNAPCNTQSPWINGTYTNLTASGSATGFLCLGGVSNTANLIDNNTSNFASVNLTGLSCNGTVVVKDNDAADTYPAGTFAGFEVSADGLLSASIAATVTITTYNNGTLADTYNAVTSLIGVSSSLLNANGNAVLGFTTTKDFDEVRISYQPLVSVLFSAQVYGAVIEKYCAGPALPCNVQTQLNNPTYPTSVVGGNTGISGLACVGCSVNNAQNVVSASTTDYATISMAVSAGSVGAISVKDNISTYTAGTFAGFNISNPNLIGVNVLSGLTIKTYLNGALRETSGSGTLVSLNSLLLNGTGEQLVGFVTTQSFNEVKLEVSNLLGVFSNTRVYDLVVQNFCAGPPIACSTTTNLITPAYPAVIDGTLTGISGVACVGCSVSNTNNLIDNNTNNFAEIILTVGVASSGSVAVKDVVSDYPAGTFAGFDIENSALIGVGLLNGASISTYLNGVLQESNGGGLISLTLLSSTRQIVGFTTTKAFDEVRFTASNLVGVNLGTTRIYNAIVRGVSAAGVTAPIIPTASANATNNCPTATVNLNSLVTSSTPVGATLLWFTNNAHTGTAYATPTTATAGTYYAFYYDSVKDCYSLASAPVTVTITTCCPTITNVVGNNINPLTCGGITGSIKICGLTAAGVYTINYDKNSVAASALTNQIADVSGCLTIIGLSAGNYTNIKVSNAACPTGSNTLSVTLTDPIAPTTPTLSATTLKNACPLQTVNLTSLTGTPPIGVTYEWHTANNTLAGTLVLLPNLAGSGTYYVFAKSLAGCYSASAGPVTVTITLCANPDNALAVAGVSTTIPVLINDTNPDLTPVIDLSKITTPVVSSLPTKGITSVNADGTIKYTPNAGTSGTDTFVYTICDKLNTSVCDTAKVTITISPAPQANADNATAIAGANSIISVLANDKNPDNTLITDLTKITTPIITTIPTKGTAVVNLSGTITYTPFAGSTGTDTFIYSICDKNNILICDTALVTVKINQKPIATNDIAVVLTGQSVLGNVLTNDFDLDGNTLTVNTVPVTSPSKGIVTLNANGTYTYIPNVGATGNDTFCYQVCDNGIPSGCDTACVSIQIVPLAVLENNAPIANDDNTQTRVNLPIIVNTKANDIDPDGFTTLGNPTKLTNPAHGAVVQLPDGTFTYTPTLGFIGKDSFTYSICDNGTPNKCDTATVWIDVLPTAVGNQAPVALDDATSTLSGTPVIIFVRNNDSDPDGNVLTNPAVIAQPVSGNATVNLDGSITYTPNNTTFVGTAIFKYAVCDVATPSKCDTATVNVLVLAPNKVCLTPKAYLQGALLGVNLPDILMRDDLRVKSLIPTTSPYSAGLTTVGSISSGVLAVTGNDAIVDWVFLELRSSSDSTLVVDSRSALIQRDGDIVDVDGISSIIFNNAFTGSYYLTVKHRNHLGVMSTKTKMSNICKVIDFRQTATSTFNLDILNPINQALVIVEQGKALWAGNVLSDKDIIYQGTENDVNSIYQQVINAVGNGLVSPAYKLKGYFSGDIDMNGEVVFQGTGNDGEFIYQNILKNHIGNTFNLNAFKIKQQIP